MQDCWLFAGHIGHNGYGLITLWDSHTQKQYTLRVHRLFYEAFKGKIPQGLTIDHLCSNRSCINPEHLEAITQGDNILRGAGIASVNARKTHCRNGHEFNQENTYIRKGASGLQRDCRLCVRERQRKSYKNKQI